MNSSALERYTRSLPLGDLEIERCAMLGGSRSGYCLLRGEPSSIDAFAGALPLQPDAGEATFRDDCRSLPEIGRNEEPGGGRVLLPGAARHVPNGALPLNDENVHLRAVTIDPTRRRICIDYEFPYG